MIKIIDRKEYSTYTAELLHEWSNHYYRSDFQFCRECLYRTPKGAYFIYGKGGPSSKYAKPAGSNAWTGGEDLEPVSEQEALDWL